MKLRSGRLSDEQQHSWEHQTTPLSSLPNLITIGRTVLVPVVFWLVLTGKTQTAFVLFLLAGVSDAIDGYLAKRFGWQTTLGAYLDPLADKLLIVSIFMAMGFLGELPSWLVIAVVSRDILILIGVVMTWLVGPPMQISPSIVSKANTTAQIVLAALVLADEGYGLGLAGIRQVLIWTTATLTIASLILYARTWLEHMALIEARAKNRSD